MLPTRALLFASTLALVPVLTAQDVRPPAAAAAAQPNQFTVGGAVVRVQVENGVTRAEVSRDGGRTFQALPEVDHHLYLRYGTFDPVQGEPLLPGALAATGTGRLFIVQARTSILPEYRAALENGGLEIVAYFPMNGYVVRCDRSVATGLRAAPWVRWVGEVVPDHRDRRDWRGHQAPAKADELVH